MMSATSSLASACSTARWTALPSTIARAIARSTAGLRMARRSASSSASSSARSTPVAPASRSAPRAPAPSTRAAGERGRAPGSRPLGPSVSTGSARLAEHLDGDLLHREGDRRLGLRGLDPHGLGVVLREQPLGDGRAQPLEGPVGALLREERHELADLAVVDGVLDPIGQRRVACAHLEAQVEDQPLAHLLLGVAHPVVGEEGEPGDLDRDVRLGRLVIVVVSEEIVPRLLGLLRLLVPVALHRGRPYSSAGRTDADGERQPSTAAATTSASRTGATSWTRK